MVFESSQLCRFDTTTWFAVDQGLAEMAPQATGGSPVECDVDWTCTARRACS